VDHYRQFELTAITNVKRTVEDIFNSEKQMEEMQVPGFAGG
jgi:hypothetical protein